MIQKINRESILAENTEIENNKRTKNNVPEEKYLQLFDNYASIQEYEKSLKHLNYMLGVLEKIMPIKMKNIKNLLLKTWTMYEDRANYLKNKNDLDNADKKTSLQKGFLIHY